MEHVFSVKRGVHNVTVISWCGGNDSWLPWYQKAWDAPIENLSCEKEVDNIYNTFVVAVTKDGEGSHHCGLSLFQQRSFKLLSW